MSEVLQKIGNRVALEHLAQLDFQFLDLFVEALEKDQQKRLAEILFPFYRTNEKLTPFLNWAVEQEVKKTSRLTQLFRGDTFAVFLLNNLLFCDLGIKYLKFLFTPFFDFIQTEKGSFSLTKEPVTQEEIILKNKMFQVVDQFIEKFESSSLRCPLFLRDLFSCISKCVEETEFEDGKPETSFALSFVFFRYMCPVLVNPTKYGFGEMPSASLSGLVSFSKLLNDISLCNHEKYTSGSSEWIKSRYQRLFTFLLTSLLNKEEIAKSKIIIESSVEAEVHSPEEKLAQLAILKTILNEINPPSRSSSTSSLSSESKGDGSDVASRFIQKFNNPNWKIKKEGSRYKFWVLKEKGIPIFAIKIEMIVNRPLEEAAFLYPRIYFSNTFNKAIVSSAMCYAKETPNPDKETEYFLFMIPTLPAIFQEREAMCRVTIHRIDENTILWVQEHTNVFPAVKRRIRCGYHLSGMSFKALSPNTTQITTLVQVDAGGMLPKWILNSTGFEVLKAVLKMKELLDSGSDFKGQTIEYRLLKEFCETLK